MDRHLMLGPTRGMRLLVDLSSGPVPGEARVHRVGHPDELLCVQVGGTGVPVDSDTGHEALLGSQASTLTLDLCPSTPLQGHGDG